MLKRLMGSSDKSAETASIIRISCTYQNDSLHLRKKRFFEFYVVFMTANQFSVPARSTGGVFAGWVLKCLGGWAGAGYLHALVHAVPGWLGRSRAPPCPLPAKASAAEVHGEVARPFPTSLPQNKERFGLQKIKFLYLGQIL